jgi:hypothetical protein
LHSCYNVICYSVVLFELQNLVNRFCEQPVQLRFVIQVISISEFHFRRSPVTRMFLFCPFCESASPHSALRHPYRFRAGDRIPFQICRPPFNRVSRQYLNCCLPDHPEIYRHWWFFQKKISTVVKSGQYFQLVIIITSTAFCATINCLSSRHTSNFIFVGFFRTWKKTMMVWITFWKKLIKEGVNFGHNSSFPIPSYLFNHIHPNFSYLMQSGFRSRYSVVK